MSELKQIISLRLGDSDRAAIQAVAARLYVRESDVYRFAINYLLSRFSCLSDERCTGSDLLPTILEIRNEINHTLELKKHQLNKIINGNNFDAEKYVAMSDIELLLMPEPLLRQYLTELDKTPRDTSNAEKWLQTYLMDKYHLDDFNPCDAKD